MNPVRITKKFHTNTSQKIVTGYTFIQTGNPETTGYYLVGCLQNGGNGIGRIVLEGSNPSKDGDALACSLAQKHSRSLANTIATDLGMRLKD